jgi:hypothetical protein
MLIILKPLLIITIIKRVLLSSVLINVKTLYNIALFLKKSFIKQL